VECCFSGRSQRERWSAATSKASSVKVVRVIGVVLLITSSAALAAFSSSTRQSGKSYRNTSLIGRPLTDCIVLKLSHLFRAVNYRLLQLGIVGTSRGNYFQQAY
jgi:hypothetical protein